MGLNDTAKNLMLDALGTAITHVSLHTDAVGSGSGGEVTGGSPAYARQACVWGSAASANIDMTGSEVFDIPAGTTVARAGFFGHITNATPYYGDAELTDEVFAGQGTYTLDDADISLT